MLTGTDWNGAMEVLSGIQGFLDQEPSETIVSYPDDGTNAQILVKKLHDIVEDNSASSFSYTALMHLLLIKQSINSKKFCYIFRHTIKDNENCV